MNKPLLTTGILLSLGTIGCAGVGVQPSSSLMAQFQNRTGQGVDELWDESEEAPRQGLQSPSYAGTLGSLWIARAQPSSVPEAAPKTPSSALGDLWNPSSVTRYWAIDATPAHSAHPDGLLLSSNGQSRRASRKSAAQ